MALRTSISFAAAAAALLAFQSATAQDARTVREPRIPAACTVLHARIAAVQDKLAEADEDELDTERIQSALDQCAPHHAVELAANEGKAAFLTGPLNLRSGVTLLIDRGVTLFASRDPALYEVHLPGETAGAPIQCGTTVPRSGDFGKQSGSAAAQTHAPKRGGCKPLIAATGVENAAIMGDGTIDGRGYATLLNCDYSWWQLAARAQPHDDIYFSPRMLVANHADGFILYRIRLQNSPNFHVSVAHTNGFTAWGVHLLTPTNSALQAPNTDGIGVETSTSTNITVAHSWIDNGDDNIAIESGTTHMSILDNHFYSGHGMSVGPATGGQAYILVDGLVLDHTVAGISIKSNVTRGGLIHDLTYRNLCMRNVPDPIAISPYYTSHGGESFTNPHYTGTKIPEYKKILLESVVSVTPGNVLIAGFDDQHRTQIALAGVRIEAIRRDQVHLAFADIVTLGPSTNIPLHGTSIKLAEVGAGVHISGEDSRNLRDACLNVFVPMQ
jgi:polygalacturonase